MKREKRKKKKDWGGGKEEEEQVKKEVNKNKMKGSHEGIRKREWKRKG